MKNKYVDLIEQSFEFPNEEFSVNDNELYWFNVPLMDIIKQYGTPLRISYLPKIAMNIQRVRRLFNVTTQSLSSDLDDKLFVVAFILYLILSQFPLQIANWAHVP